jgi:phage/plasmid-associated DNA primase
VKIAAGGLVVALMVTLVVSAAGAYTCPVLIKQAQETIAKAQRGRPTPESRELLAEARQLLGEARRHHETARSKRDHDEAVRKAKTAQGLAEQALRLQSP